MQWSVAITNIQPAVRSKFHLIAGILWLLDVRLRRIKREEGVRIFNGHEELYDRILDNMLQAIKQTYGDFAEEDGPNGEKIDIHAEGVSFIKMEAFLYGLREIDCNLNEIKLHR